MSVDPTEDLTVRVQAAVAPLVFAVCLLAATLLGFGLGWGAAMARVSPQAAPRANQPPGPVTLDQQRAIAAEVARLLAAEGHPPPAPSAEAGGPAAALPDPGAEHAKQEFRQLLDRALSAGRWTDDDRAAFRNLLGQVPHPDRVEMMKALYEGIQSKRLARHYHGPPM